MKKMFPALMMVSCMLLSMYSISVSAYGQTEKVEIKAKSTNANVTTKEKLGKESTVYAGEIFFNGTPQLTYLYSADISNNEIVFYRLKECLTGTAFAGLVPAMSGESDDMGLAVSSAHQDEISSAWTSAAYVAGQYFTGNIGSETSGNFYDKDAVYASNVNTNYAARVDTYDNPLAFNKSIGSALNTTTDFVWVNKDGVLEKEYTVTATVEETTVVYTTVNVTTSSETSHTHSYAAVWSSDVANHWHACTATGGTCDIPKKDTAAHIYGTSGNGRFTCTVCGYVNAAKKAEAEAADHPAIQSQTETDIWGNTLAAEEQVANTILAKSDENDPAGSSFSLLQACAKKVTKKSITIAWKRVPGASSYTVYGNKCGKGNKYQKLATVSGALYVHKKLKKGTYYKFLIVANGGGRARAVSKTIHVATTGGKVGNNKSVKITSKKMVTLKKGKTAKIKAKAVAKSEKLKVKKHRKLAFETDDPKVATVNKGGKIKAVGKGNCTIYIYAQDGVFTKVKVKVK